LHDERRNHFDVRTGRKHRMNVQIGSKFFH
jgi:hypothetical protein